MFEDSSKLTAALNARQTALLRRALQRYSSEVSQRALERILEDWQDKLSAAEQMADPATIRGAIYDLTQTLGGNAEIAERIRFALDISQEVTSGLRQFLNQNLTPGVVEEYPGLKFSRMFRRRVPRGFLEKHGLMVEDPDDAWPVRWQAAGEAGGDGDWVEWIGDAQTGYGACLKSSNLPQALGDGAGGYLDTLGNRFDPIAWNTGFRFTDLSREQCLKIGLMTAGQVAKPATIDFEKMISFPA